MSFTIHGISEDLNRRLAECARREQISKNRLVKRLLARAMGLLSSDRENDEYREFLGCWTREEHDMFGRAQADNDCIDDKDWE